MSRRTQCAGQPSAAMWHGIFRADHGTPVTNPELMAAVAPVEFGALLTRAVYVMPPSFLREEGRLMESFGLRASGTDGERMSAVHGMRTACVLGVCTGTGRRSCGARGVS